MTLGWTGYIMKRMLLLEFRNCLSRNEFKFIFTFLILFSVGGFLIACSAYYGLGVINTRSAFEMSLLRGIGIRDLLGIECALLPLFASIIYSDSYYSDYQTGVYNSMLTRTNTWPYLWAKAIVAFVITFFAFSIPLLLNQIFCLVAFPIQGFDNNFALPPYDIGIQNYTSGFMFDLLRIQSPLLYNLLYMFLISLAASLFALFTYGAFFVFKKNRFATIAGVFVLYLVANVAVSALGSFGFRMSLIELLHSGNKGSFSILILWMAVLFVPGIVMIILQSLKHDVGIEK